MYDKYQTETEKLWHMYYTVKLISVMYKEFLVIITG